MSVKKQLLQQIKSAREESSKVKKFSGNLMDYANAKYIKAGLFTWQQGFGLLHVDGNTVTPQLVPIINKSFTVNGKTFKW